MMMPKVMPVMLDRVSVADCYADYMREADAGANASRLMDQSYAAHDR